MARTTNNISGPRVGRPWVICLTLLVLFCNASAHADEISDLVRLLKEQDPKLREQAASDLGSLGPRAEAAIPALVSLLGDKATGDATIFSNNTYVRKFAADALNKIGPKAVPAVIDAMQHADDPEIRVGAVLALAGFGPKAEGAQRAFAAALKDSNETVRELAIQGLTKHGAQAADEMPELLRLCRDDPSVRVRFHAICALPTIDPDARQSLPALIRALDDQSPSVRSAAIRTLGDFGAKAKEAIPAVILRLDDAGRRPEPYSAHFWGEREVRADAAEALGRWGALAKGAVLALEKLRSNESADSVTRVIAAFAILRIVPENAEAMTGFIALLDDDEPWRLDCVPLLSAFEELGSKAKGAVPVIMWKLNHDDDSVRWTATRALVDVQGVDAIPEFVRLLKHTDVRTRCDAASKLGEFGPRAKAAVPALSDLLGETLDENGEGAQWSAIVALGKIGPPAKSALPRLRELLQDALLNSVVSEAVKNITGE